MCGRYGFSAGAIDELVHRMALQAAAVSLGERANHAPTMSGPVVIQRRDQAPVLQSMKWGFVPGWRPAPLVNARSESVATKTSFRQAFRDQRCLVVADCFYEWQPLGRQKQPWRFTLPDQASGLMVIAGIWHTNPDGVPGYLLLTTEANATVAPCHDRMPVILRQEAWRVWLSQDTHASDLQRLCVPYSGSMLGCPVTQALNRANYQGPVTAADSQANLL